MTSPPIAETDIAIIGMAGQFPNSPDIETYWANIKVGKDCIHRFSDEELTTAGVPPYLMNQSNYVRASGILADHDCFDAPFFGMSPKDAQIMDPQHRLLLEESWKAFEHAGYTPTRHEGFVGVYVGVGMNTYLLQCLYPHLLSSETLDAYQVQIRNDKDFLPTLISYKLNLKGPSVAVQTACSTSLVAIHMAAQSLINGECDMALAGGVTVHANPTGYLYAEGMILSPDGQCRAFDADAQGTVGGNGVGVVLLKRLEEAIADHDTIHCVIKGTAINNDGASKVGYTAPSVEGQAAVIAEAQAMARVPADSISYIESHGTGTSMGDPIEVAALSQAFRYSTSKTQFCAIGSVKTNVGHLDAAAGVAGVIKTVQALKEKVLPPSRNFSKPNPLIGFEQSPFFVNTDLKDWESTQYPRRAGVSSFGIGGTNAHVVLEEYISPEEPSALPQPQTRLFLLSAKSESALAQQRNNLAQYLQAYPTCNLSHVAYTLSEGRESFTSRWFGIATDVPNLVEQLEDSQSNITTHQSVAETPNIIFLLPGQGAQSIEMGATLYRENSTYRETVDQCAQILHPLLGQDIRAILYPEQSGSTDSEIDFSQTQWVQPLLFVVEYALAQVWLSWGIQPEAMVGHSLGEYVVACLAKVFSLEDALSMVVHRGRLMQQLEPGAMVAIMQPEAAVMPYLNEHLSLAASNGGVCTISGSFEAIAALEDRLSETEWIVTRLQTSHAFHSPMMEPMMEEFREVLSLVEFHSPQIPFLSNVTGEWIRPHEPMTPDYWLQHIRQTVRFGDAIAPLLADPSWIFLEVGPHRTLTGLVRKHPDYQQQALINSWVLPKNRTGTDQTAMLYALGKLWSHGQPLDWPRIFCEESHQRIPLPTYAFERERCWLEPPNNIAINPLLGLSRQSDPNQWFYIPTWEQLSPLSPTQAEATQTWLILLDQQDFGQRLANILRAQNHQVITVDYGDRRWFKRADYSINPQDPKGFQTLLLNLKLQGILPHKIIHLWNFSANLSKCLYAYEVEEHLERGLFTLLSLAKTVGQLGLMDAIQISVLTQNGFSLLGNETINPVHSTILGAVKVIGQEYPNLTCRYLDLEFRGLQADQQHQVLQMLSQELSLTDTPLTVAYRGLTRFGQRYIPHSPVTEDPQIKIREQGVYLVTGGLGGIGLTLARYLAEQYHARLILIGRTALPPKTDWSMWCETHPDTDKVRQRIEAVQEIEQMGGEVMVAGADVTQLEHLLPIIHRAEKQWGQLNGILHCAGVADFGGIIQGRSRDSTESILASKLWGTLCLHELAQERDLDFMMLSSSLSTALFKTLFGQVGYSAANEFLAAYSESQRMQSGTQTFAIHWTEWQEVGMAVTSKQQREQNKNRSEDEDNEWLIALTPSEGRHAFENILRQPYPNVIVCAQDLGQLIQLQSQWSTDSVLDLLPESTLEKQARGDLDTEYVPARHTLDSILIEQWENILGIAPLGLVDDFYDLGGDSLQALGLVALIQKKVSLNVSATMLLEYSTVQDLSDYLRECYPGAIADLVKFDQELSSEQSQSSGGGHPALNSAPVPRSISIQLQTGRSKHKKLFLMPPIGGGLQGYPTLCRYLNSNWEIHGLRVPGLDDPKVQPLVSIPAIAESFLQEVKKIQPQGPFYLGGWSMGGTIAYEMTKQLVKTRESIGGLILLDTPAPGALNKTEVDDTTFARSLGWRPEDIKQSSLELHSGILQRVDKMADFFDQSQALSVIPEAFELKNLQHLYQIFHANRLALQSYEMEPCPTEFPTLLISLPVPHGRLLPILSPRPYKQWQSLFSAPIQVHRMSGDHFLMMEEPQVATLATQVNLFLHAVTTHQLEAV